MKPIVAVPRWALPRSPRRRSWPSRRSSSHERRATARRRRPRTSRTSRSPSRTATTRRCSPPPRRSPRRRARRSPSSTRRTIRRSSSRSCRRPSPRSQYDGDHRPADLRAAADPDDQAGDLKGIKVVNIDQILGTNPGTAAPPVRGSSGNVVFVQTQIGQKQGKLLVAACARAEREPLQGRLPLLGQGLVARHRDPQGLRRGDRRATTSRSSPRARPSTTRRSRSRRRRRCSRRSPT